MARPDLDPGAVSALLARAFGAKAPVSFERVREGISTQVYRLTRGSDVFFLKAAEDEADSLAVDAELLRRLRARGVLRRYGVTPREEVRWELAVREDLRVSDLAARLT